MRNGTDLFLCLAERVPYDCDDGVTREVAFYPDRDETIPSESSVCPVDSNAALNEYLDTAGAIREGETTAPPVLGTATPPYPGPINVFCPGGKCSPRPTGPVFEEPTEDEEPCEEPQEGKSYSCVGA